MINPKYKVIAAIFDIKPVDETGAVNVQKISLVEPVVNLGRKVRIGKKSVLSIKHQVLRKKERERFIADPVSDFERYLNENINSKAELAAIGVEVIENLNSKPRYKPIQRIKYHPEPLSSTNYGAGQLSIKEEEPVLEWEPVQEPKRVEFVNWWQDKKTKPKKEYPKLKIKLKIPKLRIPKLRIPKFKIPKVKYKIRIPAVRLSSKKMILGSLAMIMFGFFTEYGFSVKNEIALNGNSAVANLESAGENIKNLNFDAASTNFAQAYADFAEAGDDLNFMGSAMTSLIGDLPGGGKIKSAKKLVEAGKLMADAGQAMSRAIEELAKTGSIFNPAGANVSAGGISKDLRQALILSKKNVEEARELLEDVEADSLPEDKRPSFEEFKTKLPEFEELISDAADYSKFMEEFIGTSGTKQYLLLFQNPAELRPTGGFPGSYGIISFKDGRLQDFRVDDIYNLDGQLKELYVPPIQLQHIVPNWAMRDANWFVDFPASAGKIAEFYKKESGQDVDGVITFSPTIVSNILKITGPIKMEKYGVTLNADNLSELLQEEVEYKGDRSQPKKILVDLAPLMLEKMYSAEPGKWMEIFNILVSSMDRKDILMYFRDLKLQDFSVTKGFSGKVNQTGGDYLMVTFTNVKGSKTDSVIDSGLKSDVIFEGDDVRHRLMITRIHNGGASKYGFFNKQSPTYVRVLVPENAQFLGISGNSKTNFKPLLDYLKTDFKRDEDLVRFEENSNYDSETGVTVYEEAGKREYGFWLILNPGENKSVELEYRVPGKAAGNEYELYAQKQPGLEFKDFDINFMTGAAEIGQSSVDLKKGDGQYTFSGTLDRDLPVKVIFK